MSFHLNTKTAGLMLLALASVASAAPRLGLSNTTVGTINTLPGQAGPTQTVQAYNLGDGSLTLTATASASWLSATVGAKTACAQAGGGCYAVSIALNTAALATGTYTDFITLTDPNAVDSPQDIAVTVNTTGVPSSITAYVTPLGGPSAGGAFPVFALGKGASGAVTTQSGGNWLAFYNTQYSLIPSPFPWVIQVAAQSGMVSGSYTGTVVISGSSVATDNKTITVTLVVTASPIIQLINTAVRLSTYQGAPVQSSVLALTNIGSGALSITGATSAQKFLSATASGNQVTIQADPAGLSPGTYNGSVTISSNAANNAQVSLPVSLLVSPAGTPSISSGGITNAANFAQEAVSPGDIVSIFGSQLAPPGTVATAAGIPLAKVLGTSQVLVGGVPAPLYYVSTGQINFQVPYTASGSATIQVVSNGKNGNLRLTSISSVMPRILMYGSYGVIINGDYTWALPTGILPGSHPAKPGDTVTLYGIGFGQTSPVAVEGQASSADPTSLQQIAGVTATFGGGFGGSQTTVNSAFTGLTPGLVGLYQANIPIPADAPLGPAVPLILTVNGIRTNPVNLAITATGK